MAHPRVAFHAFAVYFVLCTWLGEFFPFSRYEMYAHGTHTTGVLLRVLAEDEAVRVSDFDTFEGFTADGLAFPEGVGTGQLYQLDAIRHHILTRTRSAADDTIPDPGTRLRVGYVFVHATPEGAVPETQFHLLAEGRAWRSD